MRVVGIDPGLTGALVLLDDALPDFNVDALDMPMREFQNSKAKFIDGEQVVAFLKFHRPDRIVIELVSSRPARQPGKGQGIASTFQFGNSFGGVVAAAIASGCQDIILVTPAVWKRKFGLLGTVKDAARLLAREFYPAAADAVFKLKKHGGRADASLIARYGLEHTTGRHAKASTRTLRAQQATAGI